MIKINIIQWEQSAVDMWSLLVVEKAGSKRSSEDMDLGYTPGT